MEMIVISALILIILALAYMQVSKTKRIKKASGKPHELDVEVKYEYKPRFIFTLNEKDAYKKIKRVTDRLGLTLLAKVRLLDLIEPKNGQKNYKGALWKIQAKHVDFLVCDGRLNAMTIIELDDGSHRAKDRQERDSFVDEVLTSCGYRVIRLEAIDEAQLETLLSPLCLNAQATSMGAGAHSL